MTDGEFAGIYNDEDNQWHIYMGEAGTTQLRYANNTKIETTNTGVTITGTATATTFSGALSGNATTATTLQTARTINGVSFDGSANITVADSTKLPLTGGTLSGDLDVNANINGVNNIYLAGSLYHEGDTDTYLSFGTNTITLATGGSSEITVNTTGVRLGDTGNGYFQPVTGTYGSVQIDGGDHGGYEGYSIGGRAVFMHDNSSTMGLYDDVNNAWAIKYTFNGKTDIRYAGSIKLETTNTGVTITGTATATTFSGALSGNATTATTLQTARTINGVSFNGSANITVTANTPNTLTRGTYLTGSNFNGSAATTWAVDATSANTASKVVARDASGNFSAGTITASLSGNATTATTLQTARTINGVSFDGSANITVADSTKLPLTGGTLSGNLALGNNNITGVNELVFNDNVKFLEQGDDQYLRYQWGNTGGGGIILYDGDGTRHGTFYGSGAGETGILDNDGSWGVRIRTGSNANILYCNNNPEFYIYTSYTLSPGSSRAPIFYDYNNTSYYTNPAGVSRLDSTLVTNYVDLQYSLTGTALDPGVGNLQYKTLSANTTFTDSLASGESMTLRLSGGATYTVTWPTMTWVTSAGNVAPTLNGTNDVFVFWKENSILYGAYVGNGA